MHRRSGVIGTVVTKTLVIAGEAGSSRDLIGARAAMPRAYDKTTSKEVRAAFMTAPQRLAHDLHLNGRQYIVVAISGGDSAELLAFRLLE